MRFCFWCGGALPASKREDFFQEPAADEMAAARKAMEQVSSVEDLFSHMGQPNETVDRGDGLPSDLSPTGATVLVWRRQFRFTNLWTSLDLVVQELPNGQIKYFIFGKARDRGPEAE